MGKTSIEWVKSPDGSQGETINPTPGCSMKGCALGVNCYAFNGSVRQKQRCVECYAFFPHFHAERFKVMARNKRVTGYFFSTGEFFDEIYHHNQIQNRLNYLGKYCSQHRIYILTKQAHRLPDFIYPENIWLGASINLVKDLWRINFLRKTNAVIKFLSCEPLYDNVADNFSFSLKDIDWVIIGAETKRGKTSFKPASIWVWGLIDQARCDDTAIFLKNNLQFEKVIQEFPSQKMEVLA